MIRCEQGEHHVDTDLHEALPLAEGWICHDCLSDPSVAAELIQGLRLRIREQAEVNERLGTLVRASQGNAELEALRTENARLCADLADARDERDVLEENK